MTQSEFISALIKELERMLILQRFGRPCETGGICENCHCRGTVAALARFRAAQERVAAETVRG